MRMLLVLSAVLAIGLSMGFAETGLKSGPQVGDSLPGTFLALNVCNVDRPASNGKKESFGEQYGLSPVAMVFTRDLNEPLVKLCKEFDATVGKSKETKACVLLLTDEEVGEKLKSWAEKHGFKNVSFGVDSAAGPLYYKIAKDAAVTVVLYKQQKIVSNHAFKKGEFTEKAVAKIVDDMPKIVASK